MSPELDPQAQDLIDLTSAAGLDPVYNLSVAQARDRMRSVFIDKRRRPELHAVEDVTLPTPGGSLALRLYRPKAGRLPLALFLHGGGWMLNDIDTHDRLARLISHHS